MQEEGRSDNTVHTKQQHVENHHNRDTPRSASPVSISGEMADWWLQEAVTVTYEA